MSAFNDIGGCLRRNWRRWLLGVVVMVLVIAAYLTAVGSRVEDRRQRAADVRASRQYLCEKVNELPARLARALALTEARRHLTGPTTTVPPADLTPEERAQLAQINAELAEVVAQLGTPIDCDVASSGRTIRR